MAPRAPSARIAEQQRRAAEAAIAKLCDEATSTRRPAKKQKIIKQRETAVSAPRQDDFRKIKGRRGKLKVMTELPFDILLEIFGYLEPLDLLNISRATKELRAFITGENTTVLWKQAFKHLESSKDPYLAGPPKCPTGLSLIHYAIFLFSRNCQYCLSPKGTVVHWMARVRMCNDCAPEQLMPKPDGGTKPSDDKDVNMALSLTSVCTLRKPGVLNGSYLAKGEYAAHLRALRKCDNQEEKSLYESTWQKRRTHEITFARRLSFYISREKQRKRSKLEAIRNQRHAAIEAKLKAEGYGPELATYRYRVRNLPGGNVAAILTDKDWERIKYRIIGVYEWQRQEKRKHNMVQVYQSRMRHLHSMLLKSGKGTPKPWIHAPAPYVAQLEPFSTIMKDMSEDVDDNLIRQRLEAQAHLLPDISLAWKAEADRSLLRLLLPEDDAEMLTGEGDVDRTPLDLASTFFACDCKCTDPMTYPRILMHDCLRTKKMPDEDEDDAPAEDEDKAKSAEDEDDEDEETEEEDEDADNENDAPNLVYGIPTVTPDSVWDNMSCWASKPWNEGGHDVWIDEEATGYAKAIIRACGEDPETVTSNAMNMRHNIRVECMRCVPANAAKSKGRTRRVMTWRTAILHDIEVHSEEPPSDSGWRLVTDVADLMQVRASEFKINPNSRSTVFLDEYCRYCDRRLKVLGETPASHLSSFHNIRGEDDVKLKQHLYAGLDLPMKGYPFAVKI